MQKGIKEFIEKLKAGILKSLSANAINRVIGMLSTMVITRVLTNSDYGIWSYVFNLYSYLTLITGFGLITGALQFGTENFGKGKAYSFFKYCTKTGLLIDFIIVIVFGLIVAILKLPIDGAKPYVLIILPFLLLEFLISMGQMILRSQNRVNEYAKILNINTILIALGTCGGAFLGLHFVILGRYLASIITVIYLLNLLKNETKDIKNASLLEKKDLKPLWHYSLFSGASSAMNCLVYLLDVSLIAALLKDEVIVGIYKVGTLIPNALQFVPNSIIIAVLPNIIYNRNNISWVRKNVKKTYLGIFLLNIVLVFIMIIGAPLIIRIVSKEDYLDAVPVLRILSLGYFFSGTFRGLSVNLLASFRRVKYGLFISVVSCIFDIVFNYLFINRFGMIGAAYATLLVDVITAVISFSYVVILLKKGTINAAC